MSSRLFGLRNWTALGAFLSLGITGCPTVQSTGLPGSVTIELPDGTTVDAEQGSGAPSLANSKWQFFRTAGEAQSLAFITVNFGPGGSLDSFEENTIAREIFGSRIRFDGQRHDTGQQGVQYAAVTFGAETADASGFAFEGRLTAFAAGIKAATATASATAEYDPNDPDTVFGTFSFSTHVTITTIPGGNSSDEFPFEGRRVIE